MAIADKILTISANENTILDNVQRVYNAGFEAGKSQGGGASFSSVVNRYITSISQSDLSSIEEIGDHAFYSCEKLSSVTFPSNITKIGSYAFTACSSLRSVLIPSTVTEIRAHAFSGCSSLSSVGLAEGITTIYDRAFQSTAIKSIIIPSTVKTLGLGTFAYCSSLSSVTLPEGLPELAGSMFTNCQKMTSLTVPSTVTRIGSNVFQYADYIRTIILKRTTPPTILASTWTDKITSFIVPKGCGDAYKSATNWSAYADKITEATE